MGSVMLGSVNFMGGLIFGYNSGVIAGIFSIFNKMGGDWALSANMQGLLACSILLGALVGSIIGGPISDKFGRKVGVITLSAFTIICAPVLAAAPNLNSVIITRSFLGLGVGMSGVICPVYVSECAPPERRGALGILFQLAITVGIFIAYVMNFVLDQDWRVMFGLGAIPAIILFLLGFIMPESIVWQAQRSGKGEGERLIGMNDAAISLGEKLSIFLRSRALYIGIVLAVAQQLTGINAFMYYAPRIFSTAGIENENYPTMGLGAWNAVTTVIAVPLIDRLGRRPLLLVGTAIMSVACIALGLAFQLTSDPQIRGPIAIVMLLLFVAAFEAGDGPLFWIVAHELFTPEIRTVGQATLNACQWIFNIVLTLAFPTLAEEIGQAAVFFIFGGVGVVCSFIMLVALPETRSKIN